MKALENWVFEEDKIFYTIYYFIVIALMYSILVFRFLEVAGVPFNAAIVVNWPADFYHPTSAYIIVSFVEEVVFRYLPIVISMKLFGYSKKVWIVIVISSTLFGYMHYGFPSILIQGVMGFYLSLIFLKTGGYYYDFKRAFIVVFVAHYIYDIVSQVLTVYRYLIFG